MLSHMADNAANGLWRRSEYLVEYREKIRLLDRHWTYAISDCSLKTPF